MGLFHSKESNNEEVEIDNAELQLVVEENNIELPEEKITEEVTEEVKEEVKEEGIVSKILNSFKSYNSESDKESDGDSDEGYHD